jgi:hypothetical protein
MRYQVLSVSEEQRREVLELEGVVVEPSKLW